MKKQALIASLAMLALLATAALVSADYTDGLQAYWPFDKGSGTTAYDAVNGHNGTINGATYTGPAPTIGGSHSLLFDGSDDYILVPDDTALEGGTISVAAWVKPENCDRHVWYILAKGVLPGKRASYALYKIGEYVYYYVSNQSIFFRSPGVPYGQVCDGGWHHLAGTYNGEYVRLYVDGVEVGSGTYCVNCLNLYGLAIDDFYIGASGSLGSSSYNIFYKGPIDEVGVWNRGLSADEISALYCPTSVVWLPPITLEDWTLNENAKLPIKFQLQDCYGNILTTDAGPSLAVSPYNASAVLDAPTFNPEEYHYIAHFRPGTDGIHTANVSLPGDPIGGHERQFEVVEAGKANGKGKGHSN